MRILRLRFVRSRAGRFGLVIAAVLAGTTSACTSPRHASKPPVTATSATAAVCTAERTEILLRALFRDYNAGQDVVGTYLAGPDRFVRWWDPTLPPGGDLPHQRTTRSCRPTCATFTIKASASP